jgi:alpha-beta hydrolase superfamily lysophospholipase
MRLGFRGFGSRRRLVRFGLALGCVALVWLLSSLTVAYRLTHRPRERFKEPAPKVPWARLEEHRVTTSDGEELGAWFVNASDDSPSVVLLHGNRGCRANSLVEAETFASLGCAVLMISLRAHGDSTGYYHDVGFGARRDVCAAVEFLEARRPGRPILVAGTSMGAAAAIFAAGELGRRVRGYILESPYRDLKTAAWNRTEVYLPPVLSHLAYAGLRTVGPLFLPHLDEISPLDAIKAIPIDVPVLILAGDADRLARPEEAQALYRQVKTHGTLVLVPGAGHHDLRASAPDLFDETVRTFCRGITRASAASARDRALPAPLHGERSPRL